MYKITIEKIEDIAVLEKGTWTVVDTRPYTENDLGSAYDKESYAGSLKEIRGYLEDKVVQKEKLTKVLEQTVDDLDLVEVIKAVNKIKG